MDIKDASAHTHPWKISDVIVFPLLALGLMLEWMWPSRIPVLPPFPQTLVGLVLIVAGGILILWSKRTLDAADQPNLPGTPTTVLVTGGAFQVSRNPNYLGAVLALVGGGFLFGSIWVLAGTVLSAIVLDRWMIAPEETYLSARFGDDYAAYCNRVRRWL